MLITAKMLFILGCCDDGIRDAEDKGLLPLELDKLTVDFIINNRINLWGIAVGLQCNRSYNDELESAQENFNDNTNEYYQDFRLALQDLEDSWNTRYKFDLYDEEIPIMTTFAENYLPELISFLKENEALIVSETEKYYSEDNE